jgi:hypothetical protein
MNFFNTLDHHVVPRSGCSGHELDLRLRMSSTTTFSLFKTLPVEICLDIFSLFCRHCQDPTIQKEYHRDDEVAELNNNKSALCSLSRTCKAFQALAQPILHHHFHMQTWQRQPACLYLFARTISRRRDLANAVRVIELDLVGWPDSDALNNGPGYPWGSWPQAATEAQDIGRIEEALEQLSLAPCKGWCFRTCSGGYGLYLSQTHKPRWLDLDNETCSLLAWLTLCLCTNAKIIDCGPYLHYYGVWTTLLEVSHLPSPRGTECVRVRGESWPGRRHGIGHVGLGGDMRYLADMTDYLPNIKTLQLRFCCFPYDRGDGVAADAAGWSPGPSPTETLRSLDLSSLSSLNLLLCELTRDRLIQLLGRCPNLTEFSYIGLANLESRTSPNLRPADPGEVTDMIQHHFHRLRATLRRLVLEHFLEPERSYGSVYGPVTNLTALRTVHLGATGLFCNPSAYQTPTKSSPIILPRNIEHLRIFEARDWEGEVSEALIHLLGAMLAGEAEFDMLCTISVSFSPQWSWLEYTSGKTGGQAVGRKWWRRVGETGVVFELDSRVSELAMEAGIRLDVEEVTVSEEFRLLNEWMAEDTELD